MFFGLPLFLTLLEIQSRSNVKGSLSLGQKTMLTENSLVCVANLEDKTFLKAFKKKKHA